MSQNDKTTSEQENHTSRRSNCTGNESFSKQIMRMMIMMIILKKITTKNVSANNTQSYINPALVLCSRYQRHEYGPETSPGFELIY